MIEYENLAKLNAPFFDEFRESFNKTMEKGWYILGDNVSTFENEFANYCNAPYCTGLASGLDALTLSLRYFNFEPGSEVIVPSNTYIATILSILHNQLVPVLVEPDIHTYNLDPAKLTEAITTKTKAVIVVHLYGKPCEMNGIVSACEKYNLKLIEDCAQSHGAKYHGKMTGTFGDFGAYSFYPTKNLGALGDAGAIIGMKSDSEVAIRKLRNYGSGIKYVNDLVGFNSRLDEVQAGFLNIKLKKLDIINSHKNVLASLYHKNLKSDFILPAIQDHINDVYHIFAIRHAKRDELRDYLLKNNVKTEIHYPIPPYRQKALAHLFDKKSYPVSDLIHQTILSLPISYYHTPDDIMRVIEIMNRFQV